MNYHQYHPIDVVNGPGTRCTLFVSGCVHQCRGCYNQSTWRLDSGLPFTLALENQIIADLQDTAIPRQGLSLSGGDPLHPQNLSAVKRLVQRINCECPGKDIWLWTGYCLNELSLEQWKIVGEISVLIDGRFIQELRDPSLIWRGSSNQDIHVLR
ncbi:anaerobic ribonucleoside-triphosphate reductase-activating protein [Rouxiella sp. WC2420]|uniref:Anaerobic ribonucleoside-triphosphate reductase-activating protein n=1 Tax=Rouxiella sp. WC2420 TaxID=3234145 RepID=A0AB39VTW7_9GAMM